jgi:hypothetical protein
MTKKLEQLFDLESSDDSMYSDPVPVTEEETPSTLISTETLNSIEKIEQSLPQVRGLESSDKEMDELADMAKAAFQNLMDLGMQTDPRFSAEIFSVGGAMLGHALTAKTAKINKKLKMIDLQLKKADLDRKLAAAKPEVPEETNLGTGQVVDRNELLKMLVEQASGKSSN